MRSVQICLASLGLVDAGAFETDAGSRAGDGLPVHDGGPGAVHPSAPAGEGRPGGGPDGLGQDAGLSHPRD